MNLNEMIDVDLPSLQSIQLGNYALWGIYSDDLSCTLTMRSNNELIVNDLFCRSSKSNIPYQSSRMEFLFSLFSDIGKYF